MPAKKPSRRFRLIVLTLALMLVVGLGFGTFWTVGTVRDSFPQTTGSLKLEGLADPVTVKRDSKGIPHLYADSAQDLFRAQGYVQAQDRFYEMDVRRHVTAGRLAEMFGDKLVETDVFLRTLGWRRVAQREYDTKLSETTRNYLRAYTAGVNAYLDDHSGSKLSVEYAALGLVNDYQPARWDPVDSVAWLKAMAWDLRGNMQEEIDRALLASRYSAEQIAELYPDYPYDRNRPIVEGGAVAPGTATFRSPGASPATKPPTPADGAQTQLTEVSETLDTIPALLGPNGSGIGSNSWVVSGAYTTTGSPLLANDPHLAPRLPSVWYQMGLHCRSVTKSCPFDVSGFSFSGMPGVVIGHNQRISWGMTNMGADVSDLYLEKIEDGTYLYDGERVPYRTRTETIKVADGRDREITIRSTRNGPIVSDRSKEMESVGEQAPVDIAAPDRGSGFAVSLRWTALAPSRTMEALFALNAAADFTEFQAAARDFAVPAQNLIYADTRGNIGYQAPGQIPIRGKGDGRYPAPGWDPEYQWTGFIPQSALPWEYNPKRGYIVTANQPVIDPEKYPYHLTDDWSYGTRSQRIDNLIQAKIKEGGKISTDDMQSMQLDSSSEIAKLLVPMLLKIDVRDGYVREAQKLLEGWDYTQDSDSAAAAYFNAVWRNVLKLAFGDKMPKELRVTGECLWVRPADESGPQEDLDGTTRLIHECGRRDPESAQPDGGDRWFEVVRNLVDTPRSSWWRTPGTEREPGSRHRDELLAKALKDARWELTAKLGKDIGTWSWGRLHRLTLTNQVLGTDGPGVLKWLLNRGPWNLSGGQDAVDASGWNAAGGYEVTWVPSMRMVVNLEDFDKSRWVNLTGASGHTYHRHYTDQTEAWATGQLLPWPFSDKAVERATDAKMAFIP